MKKVMVVAYHFPPSGGAGVQRTLKFVKYLQLYGWEPIVVTARNPVIPSYDPTLLDEVPKNVRVFRTFSLEIPRFMKQKVKHTIASDSLHKTNFVRKVVSKFLRLVTQMLFICDYQIGWVPFALHRCFKLFKDYRPEVVYVSVPPFSSLIIGLVLRCFTKVNLICDFRDEMDMFELYGANRRRLAELINHKLEHWSLVSASKAVSVSQSIVENLRTKCHCNGSKFLCITNGFDQDDFRMQKAKAPGDRFVISYTGSLFHANTPKYFLDALTNLIERCPELHSNIRINIVGRVNSDIIPLFDRKQLKNIVKLIGYVPHSESLSYLLRSHLLLIIMDDLPNAGRVVTGKVFEYLAARKSILALVPSGGEIEALLRETDSGIVVPPRDVAAIEKRIAELYDDYKTGKLPWRLNNEAALKKYTRKELTRELARTFDEVGN